MAKSINNSMNRKQMISFLVNRCGIKDAATMTCDDMAGEIRKHVRLDKVNYCQERDTAGCSKLCKYVLEAQGTQLLKVNSRKGGNMKITHEEAMSQIKNLVAQIEEVTPMKPTIIGQVLNASEQVEVDGLEIKITKRELPDGTKQSIIIFTKCKVNVSLNSPVYPFLTSLTPIKLVEPDPERRVQILKAAMKEAYRLTVLRDKECKFLVGKMSDRTEGVYFLGTRKTFNSIYNDEITLYDAVKLWGYNSPTAIKIETDLELTGLVIDTGKYALRTLLDGQMIFRSIDIKFKQYMSQKDIDAGKSPEFDFIDNECQIRALVPATVKGMALFNDDALSDVGNSYGLDLTGVDFVIGKGDLKTGSWKHGDKIVLNTKDIRIINYLRFKIDKRTGLRMPKSGSSMGKQMTCHLQDEVKKLNSDKGGVEKSRLWKAAVECKAEGIKWLLGLDTEKSMDDSDVINLQTLSMARFLGNEWIVPRFSASYNRTIARAIQAYSGTLLKTHTAEYRPYITACPAHVCREDITEEFTTVSQVMRETSQTTEEVLNVFKGKIDDVLSCFEREHYTKTGERVNFVILNSDPTFLDYFFSYKFVNAGRAPVVSPASAQGITPLPLEYLERLEGFGFKSFKKSECGRAIVMAGETGLMVSQSLAACLNADYDGDMIDLAVSNEILLSVRRPMLPKFDKAEKDIPTVLSDEDFIVWLGLKYETTALSAMDIGIYDLNARLIIEHHRMIGKEMPAQDIDVMGYIRENIIQGKKHVGGKGGAALPAEMRDPAYLAQRWGVDGKVPKSSDAPITHKLKIDGAGLAFGTRSNIAVLNQLIHLTKIGRSVRYVQNDAYADIWNVIATTVPNLVEEDSEYWRVAILDIWNRIKSQDKSLFPYVKEDGTDDSYTLGAGTIEKLIAFANKLVNGNKEFGGYRRTSAELNKIPNNNDRRDGYSVFKKEVKDMITFFVSDITEDKAKQVVLRKALTCAVGVLSFGVGQDEHGNTISKSGYCFYWMGPENVNWVCSLVHPNNSYIHA